MPRTVDADRHSCSWADAGQGSAIPLEPSRRLSSSFRPLPALSSLSSSPLRDCGLTSASLPSCSHQVRSLLLRRPIVQRPLAMPSATWTSLEPPFGLPADAGQLVSIVVCSGTMQVDRKRSSYLKNKKREKARRAAEEARPSAASSSARPLSAPASTMASATIRPPRPPVSPPRSIPPPRKSLAPDRGFDLPVGRYVVRTIKRNDPDFMAALRAWPPRYPNDLPPATPLSSESSSEDGPETPVPRPPLATAVAAPTPSLDPRGPTVSAIRRSPAPCPPAAISEVYMVAASSDGEMQVDPPFVRPPIVAPVPRALPIWPPPAAPQSLSAGPPSPALVATPRERCSRSPAAAPSSSSQSLLGLPQPGPVPVRKADAPSLISGPASTSMLTALHTDKAVDKPTSTPAPSRFVKASQPAPAMIHAPTRLAVDRLQPRPPSVSPPPLPLTAPPPSASSTPQPAPTSQPVTTSKLAAQTVSRPLPPPDRSTRPSAAFAAQTVVNPTVSPSTVGISKPPAPLTLSSVLSPGPASSPTSVAGPVMPAPTAVVSAPALSSPVPTPPVPAAPSVARPRPSKPTDPRKRPPPLLVISAAPRPPEPASAPHARPPPPLGLALKGVRGPTTCVAPPSMASQSSQAHVGRPVRPPASSRPRAQDYFNDPQPPVSGPASFPSLLTPIPSAAAPGVFSSWEAAAPTRRVASNVSTAGSQLFGRALPETAQGQGPQSGPASRQHPTQR